MKRLIALLFILLNILFSTQVFAKCKKTGVTQSEDSRTALIRFGNVNVTSAYLQPIGTRLGSIVVPPTEYTYGGATGTSVLWTCDEEDLSSIEFLVATNGDDRVGGYWDLGANDGIPNVFATYFEYVGIKQTMSGVTLNRYWQSIPVTSYEKVDGKINIRLQDVPNLIAELYRVSELAPTSGSASHYCGSSSSGQISSGLYTCTQPNSYIQLKGPGMTSDEVGEDSAKHFDFWGVDNGFGYGMRTANTLVSEASCVARSATPLVTFPAMTVTELNGGQTSERNFNVEIECSNDATSGVGPGQTAIGLQVSPGAYVAANKLGLVNAYSGVNALLSDNYGDENIAKGVGIYLYNANTSADMLFVGQSNGNTGALSGWYPVLDGAQSNGSSQGGYTNYTHTFKAVLRKIPGINDNVEAGNIKSTAYVLVRVQ